MTRLALLVLALGVGAAGCGEQKGQRIAANAFALLPPTATVYVVNGPSVSTYTPNGYELSRVPGMVVVQIDSAYWDSCVAVPR